MGKSFLGWALVDQAKLPITAKHMRTKNLEPSASKATHPKTWGKQLVKPIHGKTMESPTPSI